MSGSAPEGSRIRAVLFDLGDTLVSTGDFEGIQQVAHASGLRVEAEGVAHAYREVEREFDASWGRMGFAEFWRILLERASGEKVSPQVVEGFLLRLSDRALNAQLYSDTLRCLDELERQHRALGVISNGRSEERTRGILEKTGILRYFRVVVTSGSEGVAKPEREIFERALQRIGVGAPESLYIGNLLNVDARAAQAVGMHAAWLNRQGTGDGEDPLEITSLTEVPGLIRAIESGRRGPAAGPAPVRGPETSPHSRR